MVDQSVPEQIGDSVNKFSSRFTRMPVWKRTALAVVIASLLLLLIYGIFVGVLFWERLTGEDLALFIDSKSDFVQAVHSQSIPLEYGFSTNNLAFCTASCDWSLRDLGAGTVIEQGKEALPSGTTVQKTFTRAAPDGGMFQQYYQFEMSCSNKRTALCRTDGLQRTASVLTVVNVTYPQQDQNAASLARAQLASWSEAARTEIGLLEAIARANRSGRAGEYASRSAQAAAQLREKYSQVDQALQRDDVHTVAILTGTHPQSPVRVEYEAELTEERAALAAYQTLLRSSDEINAALSLASPAQRAELEATLAPLRAAVVNFEREDPALLRNATRAVSAALEDFENNSGKSIISIASNAESGVYSDYVQACIIKNYPCPQPPNSPKTLSESFASLQHACDARANLSAFFAEAKLAYASSLISNATVSEVEAYYNVSEIKAGIDYATISDAMRDAARRGYLLSTRPSLRLAVDPEPSVVTQRITCNITQTNAMLLAAPHLQLVQLDVQPAQLPSLEFEAAKCCLEGTCMTCSKQEKYPIILVHGHAFADTTSPELSVAAFQSFATRLQDDGYVYAGNAFPREALSGITRNEYAQLPAPLVFTATYYYDSYQEEGELSFVPTKSESIEVYALRLRDVINVVQHKTGSDKVIIVAHSMGGLVSRKYLQFFGDDEVATLIMIGTPNAGVSGKVRSLCDVTGAARECQDLAQDSLFLAKLNAAQQPSIPMYTLAGRGCDGDFDGIVSVESVALPNAENFVYDGVCGDIYLHSAMLEPDMMPQVYDKILELLSNFSSMP